MDPHAPINGISLEQYAELAADVSEISDPARQVEVVGRRGVTPVDWEAAKAGWTARMQEPSLMGQVAQRFMPLYQAARARRSAGHAAPQAAPPAPPHAWPQQAPHFNQQATAFGNEVGNAFTAFGNALGAFVSSAVSPITVGSHVMVHWSDGHRYPGTVIMMQSGQVQVAFPDGRQVWVPQQYCTAR